MHISKTRKGVNLSPYKHQTPGAPLRLPRLSSPNQSVQNKACMRRKSNPLTASFSRSHCSWLSEETKRSHLPQVIQQNIWQVAERRMSPPSCWPQIPDPKQCSPSGALCKGGLGRPSGKAPGRVGVTPPLLMRLKECVGRVPLRSVISLLDLR